MTFPTPATSLVNIDGKDVDLGDTRAWRAFQTLEDKRDIRELFLILGLPSESVDLVMVWLGER
jgi:hypothetical protein